MSYKKHDFCNESVVPLAIGHASHSLKLTPTLAILVLDNSVIYTL